MIKKNLAAICLAVSAGTMYSPESKALLPTTDIAVLSESIAGNVQSMYNWAEEKTMRMLDMDMSAMLSELGIDNENNAIANVIVRTNTARQEIQNLEVAEQSVPDKDASQTIALQVITDSAECALELGVEDSVNEQIENHCQFLTPEPDQLEKRRLLVDEFIARCEALVDEDLLGPDEEPINKTLCVKASIITGSGTIDTYSPTEAQAVKEYIKLVTGVAPGLKKSVKFSGESRDAMLIQEMRKEALRSLAHASLSEVAFSRISPSSYESTNPLMSPMHILSDFDDQRFGNVTWMSTVQNVNEANKNAIYPSEILRKIAVMDSFMVHMSVLQYKQSLRMEALEASKLALKLEPLDDK